MAFRCGRANSSFFCIKQFLLDGMLVRSSPISLSKRKKVRVLSFFFIFAFADFGCHVHSVESNFGARWEANISLIHSLATGYILTLNDIVFIDVINTDLLSSIDAVT